MSKKECIEILYTMVCGSSVTEKEAVEYVEKIFKKTKETKRWKRKYLEMKRKMDKLSWLLNRVEEHEMFCASDILDYIERC